MKELFIYFVLDLVITGVYGIFLIRTFFITSTFVRFLRTFKKAMNKNEIGKENIIHFQKEINDNFDDLKDVQISFFVKRYVWKHKTLFMLSFGMLYDYYGTDFVMIMPIILKDIDNPQSIYFSFYHQEVINFYKELKN
ncbi:hypothetical protein [Mycoplasmopsis columboralis]|nr:hypothetical protein [Mycoplasmopsis columboralis]